MRMIASAVTTLCILLAGCKEITYHDHFSSGFIYCSEGNPSSFNPQLDTSGTTVDASSHQIYDRLLEFDTASREIKPSLASSWLVSDDGLVYTFQLRKDVQFHSTAYFNPSRNFNADDVIFSFNRWRDNEHPYHSVSGGIYPYFNSLDLGKIIKTIKRINGYRIEIHLQRPDSSFLANLATDFSVILSEEYAQQLLLAGRKAQIDTLPVGTGPYYFVDFRKDDFIRYKPHPNHWDMKKLPAQLVFDITPSSSLRLAKLLSGECDAIAYPSQSELQFIRSRNDIVLDEKPGLNLAYWAFNTAKPPFDQPILRRALGLAIDKNALIDTVYFGSAERATRLVPPTSWAWDNVGNSVNYNPTLARQLISQADLPNDFSIEIWAIPVQRAYNPNASKMAELIQGYLQVVGVSSTIVTYDWDTFREKLRKGEHDSVLIGWTADNGDPDNFYRPLLSCAAIESGTNRARWCSEEYDNLISQALQHTDLELRQAYYSQANELIEQELPLVPIAHAFRYQAFKHDVKGLEINPFGGIRFGDLEEPE